MRIISANLLTLVLLSPVPATAQDEPACADRLTAMAPALEADGFHVSLLPDQLEAAHREAHGQAVIRYRCSGGMLAVEVENQGLPTIPFKVLLAAGPQAKVTAHAPEWLRERLEAVTD